MKGQSWPLRKTVRLFDAGLARRLPLRFAARPIERPQRHQSRSCPVRLATRSSSQGLRLDFAVPCAAFAYPESSAARSLTPGLPALREDHIARPHKGLRGLSPTMNLNGASAATDAEPCEGEAK